MNRFQLLASACALTVLIGAGAAGPAMAQERAGKATAAAPKAEGTLDRQTRSISVGNAVFRDETITTGAGGHLHALLLDESNITVGPESQITIDEFVYDPDRSTGSMVMEQAEGVMRFVGGRISKQNPVTIETPSATLGIRGGVVISWLQADGSLAAFFLFGDSLTVDSQLSGDSAETSESGVQILVQPDGTINGPDPIDADLLSQATGIVDAPPDGQQRAEVPESELQNLVARLAERPLEPGDDFGAATQPVTIEEIEDVIGSDDLSEEDVRDVYQDLREQQLERRALEAQQEMDTQQEFGNMHNSEEMQDTFDRDSLIEELRDELLQEGFCIECGETSFNEFVDGLTDDELQEFANDPERFFADNGEPVLE